MADARGDGSRRGVFRVLRTGSSWPGYRWGSWLGGRLPGTPDLLVVNATGRDPPRRAGVALPLGARLDLPSFGVTNRPLIATGESPGDQRGSTSPLRIGDEVVAWWVRTRPGTRPLVAHPGWRTGPEQAIELLLRLTTRWRTPVPLRMARQAARLARAADGVAHDWAE